MINHNTTEDILATILLVVCEYYDCAYKELVSTSSVKNAYNLTDERDLFYALATKKIKPTGRLFDVALFMKPHEKKIIETDTVINRIKSHNRAAKFDQLLREEAEEIEQLVDLALSNKQPISENILYNLRELVLTGKVTIYQACKAHKIAVNQLRKFIYGDQLHGLQRRAKRLYLIMYNNKGNRDALTIDKESLYKLSRSSKAQFNLAYRELYKSNKISVLFNQHRFNIQYV